MNRDPAHPWLGSPWPLSVALTLLGVVWLSVLGNPFETQELQWFDQCLKWRSAWGFAESVDPRIVHVDITASDLRDLPTPQEEYQAAAQVIEQASGLGAELVVFDIIYSRGTAEMASPIVSAIQNSRARVVLAEGFSSFSKSHFESERVTSFPHLDARPAPAGLVNIEADQDGVYRDYSFVQAGPEDPKPSLALASYFVLTGLSWPADVDVSDPNRVSWRELSNDGTQLVEKEIGLRAPKKHLLDFRSGWNGRGQTAFKHLTLSDLRRLFLKTEQEKTSLPLSGKIIFVSYVAAGVSDFGPTPFGAHQPLVQLHSTALNDLIQNSGHRRFSRWADGGLLIFLLVGGLIMQLARSKKTLTVFWFLGMFAVLGVGMVMTFKTPWVLPTVAFAIFWFLAFIAELFRRHSLELIARLKLRITMGYYFSPRVLKRVLANPGFMEPQQVDITVLLADLRNFTPLSEQLGTRGIFALLNQVFAEQIQAVTAEDATLEHFIGDQFMCYWGAPDPQPDRADRALRGALNLIKAMDAVRETLAPEVRALYGYGAALHSGRAMIGNIGSLDRMDYGVMGDLINSAARIESLTKYYGVPLILTREAFNDLSTQPPFRLLDSVLSVGKTAPLELIEIKHSFSSPSFEQVAAAYEVALGQYRKGNFSEAHQTFKKIDQNFGDLPSKQLARRCEDFEAHPPKDWTGIYQFRTK